MGIRPTATAAFIPVRESVCERGFTIRKRQRMALGSDNGCSVDWETCRFTWCESAQVSGQIALADLKSTPFLGHSGGRWFRASSSTKRASLNLAWAISTFRINSTSRSFNCRSAERSGDSGAERVGAVMGSTLAKASAGSQLNSINATSQGPLIGVNRGAEVLAITKRVHADLGLKQEAAAAQANVKPSQYSTALSGTGNFGITWLYAQDDAFMLRWVELVMEYRGLTPENKRAVRACRIVELVRLLTED